MAICCKTPLSIGLLAGELIKLKELSEQGSDIISYGYAKFESKTSGIIYMTLYGGEKAILDKLFHFLLKQGNNDFRNAMDYLEDSYLKAHSMSNLVYRCEECGVSNSEAQVKVHKMCTYCNENNFKVSCYCDVSLIPIVRALSSENIYKTKRKR